MVAALSLLGDIVRISLDVIIEALLAVAALPVMLIPHVPLAHTHVRVGAYELKLAELNIFCQAHQANPLLHHPRCQRSLVYPP